MNSKLHTESLAKQAAAFFRMSRAAFILASSAQPLDLLLLGLLLLGLHHAVTGKRRPRIRHLLTHSLA